MAPSAEARDLYAELELLGRSVMPGGVSRYLDDETRAMVRIGTAICVDAPATTFANLIESAFAAGASEEQIVGVLLSVGSIAGEPRVVRAASRIALALGYDIDRAFETE